MRKAIMSLRSPLARAEIAGSICLNRFKLEAEIIPNMLLVLKPAKEEVGLEAARIVANAVRRNPALRLGLATGSTTLGMYKELIRLHREESVDFSRVVTF